MADSIFNLNDFDLEGKAIIESAKRQAEEMLRSAQKDIAQKKEEAIKQGFLEGHAKGQQEGYEKGFQEGTKSGIAEVEKKTAYLKDNLLSLLSFLEAKKTETLLHAESDLIYLSIEIAKKITRAKFELEPELIKESVVSAIKFTSYKSDINIFLNPEDRLIIESYLPEIKVRFDELDKISLVDDVKIERGGCVISSKAGEVDQTVELQFQKITQKLLSIKNPSENI